MSTIWKMFRGEKHKWYLGLPKHIQLTCIVFDIVFIGIIIINQYILSVLNSAYIGNYIALRLQHHFGAHVSRWRITATTGPSTRPLL